MSCNFVLQITVFKLYYSDYDLAFEMFLRFFLSHICLIRHKKNIFNTLLIGHKGPIKQMFCGYEKVQIIGTFFKFFIKIILSLSIELEAIPIVQMQNLINFDCMRVQISS